ncbi:MAG: hypothetical protein DCC58_05095 [Chloroflexi bacterium]|nr:MAG: hypothetical protein DCC58_05095 [Chloroflexota bacterium]
MSNAAWKRTERRVAELLGGQRLPVSGRGRGDAPDVEHERLSIEVKRRQSLPAWLHDAMSQAEAAARDGKLPVVVLHQSGQRYDEAVCVLRLDDLRRLLGG